MKEIILACGKIALVDEIDADLAQFDWCATGSRGNPYAGRGATEKRVYMHLIIMSRMGLIIPKDMEPDHKDKNTLNNTRDNLRVVTKSINRHNTNTQHDNTSGVRGVDFSIRERKWKARISIERVRINLGTFNTFEEARAARIAAEIRYGVHYGKT